MSTLVFTKPVANSSDLFHALCDRMCWPTQLRDTTTEALLHPEAAQDQGWKATSSYWPRRHTVMYGADGRLSCDGDYKDLVHLTEKIRQYLAGHGEIEVVLPRPSKLFCQKFTLLKHQQKLATEGVQGELVLDGGEWCLDVEMPEETRSLETAIS